MPHGQDAPWPNTLLARNLEFVLRNIRGHFSGDRPKLMSLLLFFYCYLYGQIPTSVPYGRFKLAILKGPQFLGREFLQVPK